MTIWLDMDGTIADLYGQKEWLEDLRAENIRPYKKAKRLVEEKKLIRLGNTVGADFGIISWTAKEATKEYDREVRQAKKEWLKRNYPNIKFKIHIVKYGTPKRKFKNENDILFDDEERNLEKWGMNGLPAEILRRL